VPSIVQLKYILAVHRYGHFGEAAKACGVSQPTLSAQIQKAEEELGITLFDRTNKPVSVTERGAALVEQAQVVHAAHERMLRLAKGNFEEVAGGLSLGVIPTVAPYVLPWFLRKFATRYPLVNLEISEMTTPEIVEALARQTLDVGLLALPLQERRTRERPIFTDPFYLYAAPQESLLEHDEVSVADLDPKKLWLLREGHCVRNQMLSLCNGHAGTCRLSSVTFAAGSFETIRYLIDAADGYTIIPETFARQLPRATRTKQVRAFAGPTPVRKIGLVHLRNTWKPDLFDALEATIREALPRPFRTQQEGQVLSPISPEAA
jgi:LysR family hydrogen peroxide-inducible transcriptional activator